jgi:hypothetical protein
VVIAAIVVAVLLVLGFADWFRTNQEVSSIYSAEKVADRPLGTYLDNVNSHCFGYKPCVADAARPALPRVSNGLRRLEHVSVLPWHRSAKRCRDRLVDYYKAWVADLRTDVAKSDTPNSVLANIDSNRRLLKRACSDALPMVPLFDLQNRYDKQFA